MKIFEEIEPLRAFLSDKKKNGCSVGLVPTMGALHKGHLSLIKASKRDNDITVATIYVNPAQFNNAVDLDKYPRTLAADKSLLMTCHCDVLFLPSDRIMYPEKSRLSFDFDGLDQVMEGKFRPGHFSGVALVVSKLFNIVSPDRAYFGQKDFQQMQIIRQLVSELRFPIELRSVPVQRSEAGLALSSRNQRLDQQGLAKATHLYQSLTKAKQALLNGGKFLSLKKDIEQSFSKIEGLELEYFEMADLRALQPLESFENPNEVILLIAAYVDGIRLIDNMLLTNDENRGS